MVVKIGLIAEDQSDIDVIKMLGRKLAGRSLPTAQFVGKGCGPIKRKTRGWCQNFHLKGCTAVLLVHDLDRNDQVQLRKVLEQVVSESTTLRQAVAIPVEELEAWLLSDCEAIASALKLAKPLKTVTHPEQISSPKEYIRNCVYRASNKKVQYVNSVHNALIAERIDVNLIQKKCPSFEPFAAFFARSSRAAASDV